MKYSEYATIANFNCTFKINSITYPMLEYFESIIWPAFNDTNLVRIAYKRRNKTLPIKYYISDTKLIKLEDGNFAIIGKHIKRTILEISEDYQPNKGFFGEEKFEPSAPFSTFILLLNNHKLIYFPNKAGAPDIRSFATTTRSIVDQYIDNQRSILLNSLDKDEYPAKEASIYIRSKYPTAELNIVPIESDALVKEAFKNIYSIKNVKFKFYKPNNEPLDFNDAFEVGYGMLEFTDSTSMEQKYNSPKKITVIEDAVLKSKGKTFYTITATTNNKEPIVITPDKISPKIEIEIDPELTVDKTSLKVYNQLKDRKELTIISEENKNTYNKFRNLFAKLIK